MIERQKLSPEARKQTRASEVQITSNNLFYVSRRSQIIISLKQVNNIAKIQIHDNGIGIPKKDWKNIFRPGFSTKKTGWGLGLSLRYLEEELLELKFRIKILVLFQCGQL